MNFRRAVLLNMGIIMTVCAYAQTTASPVEDTTTVLSPSLSSKYLDKVSSKAHHLEQKLDKETLKALHKWQKEEARIKRKLSDSLKAAAIFGNAEQQYKQLEQKLQNPGSLQEFIPGLDSMASSLKFLQQNPQLLSQAKGPSQKLNDAISKVNGLESQFQKTEDVKNFLKERKQYLKQQLSKFGFTKKLKKLSKLNYYYSEQINEYKTLLKDKKKAERKALKLLSKVSIFQEFMQKNSYLGQLFSLPGNYSTAQSLTGLQTRIQVQQIVSQQIGTTPVNGADPRQYVQGQMQQAQQQLDQLKDKIKSLGIDGESGDLVMPEFKRNNLKVKPFLRRLEYGFDMQNQRSTQLLPVTSDFSVTIGYKVRNEILLGLG